jgi:hypothetical protein
MRYRPDLEPVLRDVNFDIDAGKRVGVRAYSQTTGMWLRGPDGEPTRAFQHICWDGCMFPNATLENPKTWNTILGAMEKVRKAL